MTDTHEAHSPTYNLKVLGSLGVPVYGLGAIVLGMVGLVSGDFADVWQPVPASTPGRKALAYIAAVCLIVAGAAIQRKRFARAGLIVLGILYFIFALLWLPRVVSYPQIFGTWGGVFEQLSLVAAALVVYASVENRNPATISRTGQIGGVVYGICVLAFALNHFFAIPETANMVPKWIPPGQHFWAVATGVAHLLAAMAILSGVLAVLASRLLTLMLILFGALVWMPSLFAHPREHMVWSGNAISLAMASGAWVIADWIASRQSKLQDPPDSTALAA
ncbi:MAG: hypothetical protein ACR2JB_05540 [Bryobacteraceae bacterium]